jgi:hypothetical protein
MSSVEATKRDARGRPTRDTKWRARFRDLNGRSRSKTFDRKIDAERFLAGAITDMATTVKLAPTTRRGY